QRFARWNCSRIWKVLRAGCTPVRLGGSPPLARRICPSRSARSSTMVANPALGRAGRSARILTPRRNGRQSWSSAAPCEKRWPLGAPAAHSAPGPPLTPQITPAATRPRRGQNPQHRLVVAVHILIAAHVVQQLVDPIVYQRVQHLATVAFHGE